MKNSSMHARVAGYRTILDAVADAPAEQLFAVSAEFSGRQRCREVTFGEFEKLTARLRSYLRSEGITAGDPVALMMDQGVLVMAAFVAAMQAGAVPTILAYPTFKVEPEKYRHGLLGVTETIRPRLVLVDQGYPEPLRAVIAAEVRTIVEDELPAGDPLSEVPAASDSVAFLQHSAGTTGLQKGVALPHRAVLNQLLQLIDALRLSEKDRIVSWLPLYHDMGLVACFVLPLVCHLPVVMMSPTDWILKPEIFLRLAGRYKATLAWLPNFAFQFMARRVPEQVRCQLDLSSLRLLISTSEPIRAASFDEFEQTFSSRGLGPTVLQTSYGMAENTFAVTQSPVDRHSRPARIRLSGRSLLEDGEVASPAGAADELELVSCGRPLANTSVEIASPEGSETLGDGLVGELRVSSDCLFDGYFRRSELTRDAFDDQGRYRTGDLGFRQGDDFYVLGRLDDVIIVGGRNVFPEDVESATARHPDVRDGRVVAFGVENSGLGTDDLIVVAEVQLGSAVSESEVRAWIREEILAEVGVAPRRVQLVEPGWIVKSTAGKPARSTCRKKYLGEVGK